MRTYDRSCRFESVNVHCKLLSLSFSFLITSFCAISQEESTRNPYIYTTNSFSISLGNSFNTTDFNPVIGTGTPSFSVGNVHKINFDYTFSLGHHFGVSMGAGFGFFPFMYRVDAKDDFSGTEGWAYWHLVDYNIYGNLNASLDYRRWIGKKYAITGSVGAGVSRFSAWGVGIGGNGPNGVEYDFNFQYNEEAKGFIQLKLGVDKVLKNSDLIGLALSYQHHLKPVFTGDYLLYNYESVGEIVNKGHNIGLVLNYTFTRARKMKYAEEFIYDQERSAKDARKEFRKNKRFIDPKSIFIGVSSGLFYNRNIADKSADFMISQGTVSWIIQGDVEMGIKDNVFMQYGFSVAEYWTTLRVNRPYSLFWSASNAFVSPTFSAGMGYRLIGKNNINYLNISAGVGVGFNFTQKGLTGSSGMSQGNAAGEIQYTLQSLNYSKHHVIPTAYLNLSRDFQLSKSLYLSADYRFNLGVINVYEQELQFNEQPDLTAAPEEGVLGINGTSNAFQIGLKYKFLPKAK